ncbi:MAG: thioredoxin fold domain-containing protein [Gammaproteobacteria bacterium]|nr:thioredoxin fold domain-containing protein [Gammaproteobacteria bacterium]
MLRFLLLAISFSWFSLAAAATPSDADFAAIKEKITKAMPGFSVDTMRPSPVPGWYEVEDGLQIVYVSADGKHLLAGDLYDVATRTNLTAAWREKTAIRLIDAIGEKNMIVMGPKQPKRTITVFTDVDCAYCRKLHLDVPELNKHGVKVRYLAFPRSGPNTESYYKAVSVWCSADRVKAVGIAKAGGEIERKTCANPVDKEYELGRHLGISGTPAIFFDDGRQLGGYAPVPQLLAMLGLAPAPAASKNGS